MGEIVINVGELICQAPQVTHSEWTGIRYEFSVDYNSLGDEYIQFDSSTNLELSIEVYEQATMTLEFSGVINTSAPFDAVGYTFNVMDYYPNFSSKYLLILKLSLTSNLACNELTSYTFPINYP